MQWTASSNHNFCNQNKQWQPTTDRPWRTHTMQRRSIVVRTVRIISNLCRRDLGFDLIRALSSNCSFDLNGDLGYEHWLEFWSERRFQLSYSDDMICMVQFWPCWKHSPKSFIFVFCCWPCALEWSTQKGLSNARLGTERKLVFHFIFNVNQKIQEMYNSSLKLSYCSIFSGILPRNDLLWKGFPTGVLVPCETWYFALFPTIT